MAVSNQIPVAAPRLPGQRVLSADRRVQIVWALLVLNVLTYYPMAPHVMPIPAGVGRLITQGALVVALLVVLSVNRPARVRPSVFILLYASLGVLSLVTALGAEFILGAIFRASRMLLVIAVLWLLSPWWGRRDLLLVRAHLTSLWVILGTVVAGLAVAPGLAYGDDRLAGVLWPIPPTQVAHYAALALGLVVVLWLSGLLRWELTTIAAVVTTAMLIATHTRTALVAMIGALVIAGLSLFVIRSRVRHAFAVAAVVASVIALTLSSVIATWLARDQSSEELAALTGRRQTWQLVLSEPRSTIEMIFGSGLSNKSFNGLPIDSNWIATYHDLGVLGVAISAGTVLFVLVAAALRPRGPERALALFLASYCFIASFSETGLSDASPYVLELALAASLLAGGRENQRHP